MGIQPKKTKKGLRIPNLCPFKDDLLRQALKQKMEEKEELEKKRFKKNKKRITYSKFMSI